MPNHEPTNDRPMRTEDAGAAWGPPAPADPPRRITARDIQRTIASSGVEQTIPTTDRALERRRD